MATRHMFRPLLVLQDQVLLPHCQQDAAARCKQDVKMSEATNAINTECNCLLYVCLRACRL
jgi:hypothetical protein